MTAGRFIRGEKPTGKKRRGTGVGCGGLCLPDCSIESAGQPCWRKGERLAGGDGGQTAGWIPRGEIQALWVKVDFPAHLPGFVLPVRLGARMLA